MKSRLVKAGGGLTAVGLAVVAFLHTWEGLELKSYPDPVSRGEPWTICYGETKGVKPGQTSTRADCERRLIERLVADFEPEVVRCITPEAAAEAPDGVYLSMIEGAYNYGTGAFCKSTAAKRAQKRDWRGTCEALTWFIRAGGKVVKGLQNRRKAAFQHCIREGVPKQAETLTRSRTALPVDKRPLPAVTPPKTCFLWWCW